MFIIMPLQYRLLLYGRIINPKVIFLLIPLRTFISKGISSLHFTCLIQSLFSFYKLRMWAYSFFSLRLLHYQIIEVMLPISIPSFLLSLFLFMTLSSLFVYLHNRLKFPRLLFYAFCYPVLLLELRYLCYILYVPHVQIISLCKDLFNIQFHTFQKVIDMTVLHQVNVCKIGMKNKKKNFTK